MIKPYSIEPMRVQDLDEVCIIEEITGLNRWGYDAYERELLKNPDSIMLTARNTNLHAPDHDVIGFFAGWVVEDELHVNNIASHPDHRRMGIALSLMETAISEARLRGVAFVLLEVRASNSPAQTLYRKMGFRFVGKRPDYYRSPAEDAMLMKLDLE